VSSKNDILTVTINPALDYFIHVKRMAPGEAQWDAESSMKAGGKGVNVSRVLGWLNARNLATGIAGGVSGRLLRDLMQEENIPSAFLTVEGEIRINATIYESHLQKTTRLLEKGPRLSSQSLLLFKRRTRQLFKNSSWLVLSGRTAEGAKKTYYAELVRMARKNGVRVLLDTNGPAFREGLKAVPTMIKPNLAEAEYILKTKLTSEKKIIQAIKKFHKMGIATVLLSRGAQGAIVSNGTETWQARNPYSTVTHAVGCGDAMIAGFLYSSGRNTSFQDNIRMAMACACVYGEDKNTRLTFKKNALKLLKKVQLKRLS